MGTRRAQHFLLTRMNAGAPFASPGTGLDPAWLAHRLRLFRIYCLPSILAQKNRDFLWLLFCHRDTPVPFRAAVLDAIAEIPFARAVWCTDFDGVVARDAVIPFLSPETTHVITSRLDNDDAIGASFMGAVQTHLQTSSRGFITFRNGFMLGRGRLYRCEYPNNPFCSFLEERGDVQTVFCVGHRRIASVAPVREIDCAPLWMAVIHDRNANNAVAGRACSLAEMRSEFGFLAPWALRKEQGLWVLRRGWRRVRRLIASST